MNWNSFQAELHPKTQRTGNGSRESRPLPKKKKEVRRCNGTRSKDVVLYGRGVKNDQEVLRVKRMNGEGRRQ